ncbi:Mur ligase family protein [Fredinandcohnia sp. 179-A 10B2 NHS]|uniref:Mur ligase family protein n=1 Tax=Fredinandcohnia sp. 179-A 10B2 NHS TaxID=3235176 RepID=UPI0039A067F2
MNLKDLITNIDLLNEISSELLDYEIKGITDNSSEISKGDLFVAISGYQKDGHDFINDAIKAGALAIIGERDTDSLTVPYFKVTNSRKSLGMLAKNYYNNPSKRKVMIGITGTNGKTTTSYLIRHVLEEQGITCSVIGTNQNIINGNIQPASQTTPSTLELHKLLQQSNDPIVILEVSSHGLAQHRIEGIEFDYCLFTNLGHDHLDYHSSIEEYFNTKQKLFDKLKPDGVAVINADDHYGNRILTSFTNRKNQKVISIGREVTNSLAILEHELSRTHEVQTGFRRFFHQDAFTWYT